MAAGGTKLYGAPRRQVSTGGPPARGASTSAGAKRRPNQTKPAGLRSALRCSALLCAALRWLRVRTLSLLPGCPLPISISIFPTLVLTTIFLNTPSSPSLFLPGPTVATVHFRRTSLRLDIFPAFFLLQIPSVPSATTTRSSGLEFSPAPAPVVLVPRVCNSRPRVAHDRPAAQRVVGLSFGPHTGRHDSFLASGFPPPQARRTCPSGRAHALAHGPLPPPSSHS